MLAWAVQGPGFNSYHRLSEVRRQREKSEEVKNTTSNIIKCVFMGLLAKVLFVMATYWKPPKCTHRKQNDAFSSLM